jgi:Polyketide cyclase / dehydrase and lipid transport
MKWTFPLALVLLISQSHAQENANPFDVQVNVRPIEGRFQIQASYEVPINICNAFSFITAYEGAKSIPGILESKIISRSGNKVRVYRVIEESVLLFPIEMKSIVEYTETPNRLLTFEQISGDTKFYKGSWRLTSDKANTSFKYEALVEPNSLIPSAVIEYFMRNSIRGRFELMAQRAAQHKAPEGIACK